MPDSFGAFLTFLGSSVAIGAVLSIIAENWPWFQKQGSGTKTAVLIAVSTLMGLVSRLAVTYIPTGIITAAEPYYQIVISSLTIVLSSKIYHDLWGDKAKETRAASKTITVTASTSTTSSSASSTPMPPTPPEAPVPPEVAQPEGTQG